MGRGPRGVSLRRRLSVLGRLIDPPLSPLVLRGDHPRNLRRLPFADLRDLSQGRGVRVEHRLHGPEVLEEVVRERLPDVWKALDDEPLSLPQVEGLRFVPQAVRRALPVLP